MIGMMASSSETAPRKPTHETKAVSGRGEIERDKAEPYRQRTRDENEKQPERDADRQDRQELRRRRVEPEDEEHDDLRQPGQAVMETLDRRGMAHVTVADDKAGDIDGQEA